jgi:Holliday junction DNA helicase RuvB
MTAMPRPAPRFRDFIGHEEIVAYLLRQLAGAQARNEPFPPALFIGPSGVGKTLLARALAAEYGTRLVEAMGYEDRGSLTEKLLGLNTGDFLQVDEAHRLRPLEQELFYQAIDSGSVPNSNRKGAGLDGDGGERLNIKPWTLVLATDRPGSLLDALRKRMVIEIALTFYPVAELKEIVEAAATVLDLLISPQAAKRIAEIADGLPRRAVQLLQNVRFFFPDAEKRQIGQKELREFLAAAGYDEGGLASCERRYLALVLTSGGASLESLALGIGIDAEFVRRQIEPVLVRRKLVRITPAGRQLTDQGRKLAREGGAG